MYGLAYVLTFLFSFGDLLVFFDLFIIFMDCQADVQAGVVHARTVVCLCCSYSVA